MANTINNSPLAQRLSTTVGIPQPGSTPIPGVSTAQPSSVAPSAKNISITKFQFRKLFTMAERMGIDNAQYHPTLTGSQKAAVATISKDLDSSGEVLLGTPDVTAGINYLVSVGLLTTPRAARILANLPPL